MWLADVRMKDDADWARWFASSERFILHYAELAQELGVDVLSVGARSCARRPRHAEADWRRLIARVREVYAGRLTYAANWPGEFDAIAFWDALDFTGIQAYFPLGDEAGAGVYVELRDRVARARGTDRARGPSHRQAGPVHRGGLPQRARRDSGPGSGRTTAPSRRPSPGLKLQADAYEAMFRTFWRRDWFAGAFIWK